MKLTDIMCYCDPMGPEAPDNEEFETLLYIALGKEKFELLNALIGARFFGMTIVPDERSGRRIEGIAPELLSQYQAVFMKHIDLIRESLRAIAEAD